MSETNEGMTKWAAGRYKSASVRATIATAFELRCRNDLAAVKRGEPSEACAIAYSAWKGLQPKEEGTR